MKKKRGLREERELQRRSELRRAIIHAAEEVIIRKGYNDVTMDDVAREAQVSKATLYQYVRTKGELVMEILLHSFEDVNLEFGKIMATDSGAADKLRATIRFYLEFHKEKENISRVIFVDPEVLKKMKVFYMPDKLSSTAEKALLKRFWEERTAIFNKGCELVLQGVRSGEFRDVDPEKAVIFTNAVLEGYYQGKYWFGKKMTLEDETEFLCRFLLNGLRGVNNDKGDIS